jgi:hypothetical protein
MRKLASVALLLCAIAPALQARRIPHAAINDHSISPALQRRTDRHVVALVPRESSACGLRSECIVVFDTHGEEVPRVVLPQNGEALEFLSVYAYEKGDGTLLILVSSNPPAGKTRRAVPWSLSISSDAGATWKNIDTNAWPYDVGVPVDLGGPYVKGRDQDVRLGTDEFPFVFLASGSVYAVAPDGTTRTLYRWTNGREAVVSLVGSNVDRTLFLARTVGHLWTIDLAGTIGVLPIPRLWPLYVEGFLASDGGAYFSASDRYSGILWYSRGETLIALAQIAYEFGENRPGVFAVPNHDGSGAWIVERRIDKPSSLYLHTASGGMVKQWDGPPGLPIDALHTDSAGRKLLIQSHRTFGYSEIDTNVAIAVWDIGGPAPAHFDDLQLDASPWFREFLHLNVDTIESGDPFVYNGAVPGRASLRQRLVLPSIGRIRGAFGSDWASDLVINNRADGTQTVVLTFVPSSNTSANPTSQAAIALAPHETRMFTDVLRSLFSTDNAFGALFIEPETDVQATARTYTTGADGSHGFWMEAIDAVAGSLTAGNPATFTGALRGATSRTNVAFIGTDGDSSAALSAHTDEHWQGTPESIVSASRGLPRQFNDIAPKLGLETGESGTLVLRPTTGAGIAAVFTVDNRTNNAMYFAPDAVTTSPSRTFPFVAHIDGPDGSHTRTDLDLYNSTPDARQVRLNIVDDQYDWHELTLTLLPYEARTIQDVVRAAFAQSGVFRLDVEQGLFGDDPSPAVHATARTYTLAIDGGTYGFVVPPLEETHIAHSGQTLEILGVIADHRFRTDLGLVNINEAGPSLNVTILDSTGRELASFPAFAGSISHVQNLLGKSGIGDAGPIVIRIAVSGLGSVAAYATTNMGMIGSSYLPAKAQ